jgi:hypothetical protein
MSQLNTPPEKDPHLWQIAQKRASFKSHLATYVVVNALLWFFWFSSGSNSFTRGGVPWPVWPMAGWGIGLIFNYINAYVQTGDMVEREYEKLKKENSKI